MTTRSNEPTRRAVLPTRKEWETPKLRRLAAGGAELGGTSGNDGYALDIS